MKIIVVAVCLFSLLCNAYIAIADTFKEEGALISSLTDKNDDNIAKIANYIQMQDSKYSESEFIKILALKLFISSSNRFRDILLSTYSINNSLLKNNKYDMTKMVTDITIPFYKMIAPASCKEIKKDLEIASMTVGGKQGQVIQNTISLLDEFVTKILKIQQEKSP